MPSLFGHYLLLLTLLLVYNVCFVLLVIRYILIPIACLQEDEGSSAVTSALRGGKWLLADNNEQGCIAQPGRRQVVPIKSVRGPGLRLDLSAEMGDCPRL